MTLPSSLLPGDQPAPSEAQSVPPTPVPAAPPPPPPPVEFPLGWLLAHASAAIKYRAYVDVARLTTPANFDVVPYSHRPAIEIAVRQRSDGTWGDSMLELPSPRSRHFEGIGTITAVRRLLECGWDRNSPPFARAKRILFRLLAEDDDPSFAYELRGKGKDADDSALTHRGRVILREAAASALAQAGYEGDPRLRGAARRILDRVSGYVRSAAAAKPFTRVGNQHVLPEEAAPPSIYALHMLAHMPLFRTEYHEDVDVLYRWLSQPMPRMESVQLCGKHVVEQPHLVLGDPLPHRNAADADVPAALQWLELMARLGFLRRHEGWCKLFERFLDDRDANGIWHPHKGGETSRTTSPYVWAGYPLEETQSGDERWTDATFRLGLIARLSGRTIELV